MTGVDGRTCRLLFRKNANLLITYAFDTNLYCLNRSINEIRLLLRVKKPFPAFTLRNRNKTPATIFLYEKLATSKTQQLYHGR